MIKLTMSTESLDKTSISENYISKKIEERSKAKNSGNFVLADKIREELLSKGIMIEDQKGKTVWKIKNAKSFIPVSEAGSILDNPKLSVPIHPLELVPNIRPKPIIQKTNEPSEMSITFFIMMLIEFLALAAPDSSNAKPICIKNTRAVAIKVQTISNDTGLTTSIKTPYNFLFNESKFNFQLLRNC